jgi:lipoprotein-releasing system ATP-binding protein
MSENVLTLNNISRTFEQGGKTLTVLSHFDLHVRQGEIVALVGQSGSGKTTLLQIAGLLDRPSSGQVLIKGQVMNVASDTQRTLWRRQHIGFVYQFHHLLPEFSAEENVMLPQMMAGATTEAARQKAQALLGELGLSDRLTHRPARLSGGEQQRVAIARALANDPALLLADEPTGNLDPVTAEFVFGMLLKLCREKQLAVLMATHNLELARRVDRTVRLENGLLK